ncbi:hypothetical protein K435DRAFT_801054 [Dendrothele bispora CBS 962.96]|uniref:Uncharacterized protein n=1 Tax=Dendrothele bispora (strain CBS 962.96) TaxID=1314807 RepID=A0A4S8LR87_DENBC|nr:hypothetical protein K435DRAFT_801054 [Dendrothele bispora CBS 962.96]
MPHKKTQSSRSNNAKNNMDNLQNAGGDAPVATPDAPVATPVATVPAQTKRGRPAGRTVKGQKANTVTGEDNTTPSEPLVKTTPTGNPKTASQTQTPALDSHLQVENPPPNTNAPPVKKRTRRTKVQMAAARAEMAAAKAAKAQQMEANALAKRKGQAVVELNAELIQEQEQANRVFFLSDVREEEEPFRPIIAPNDSDGGEHFDFEEVDGAEYSDEDCRSEETVRMAKTPKTPKRVKGGTRASVDSLKQQMRIEKNQVKSHALDIVDTLTSGPGLVNAVSVRPNANSQDDIGLPSGWRNMIQHRVPAQQASRVNDIGGVTDDDVFSLRPSPEEMAQAADEPQVNNMISIVPVGPAYKAKPRKAAMGQGFQTTKPVPVPRPAPLQRYNAVENLMAPVPAADNTETLEIPKWVQDKWPDVILPSLYHLLWVSDAPFTGFTKGAQLVSHVQRVLDVVCPGHTLVVESDSPILKKAWSHLTEKRSYVGELTLKLAKAHFAKLPSDPEYIQCYCAWALPYGPALWQVPISREHPDEDDPLYTPPQDIFESSFVIEALTAVLWSMQKSVLGDLGYPRSALALVVVGVERGFIAHDTGVFIDPVRRWESILRQCQMEKTFKESQHAPLKASATMEQRRRNLYVSSPVRPTGTPGRV